MNPRLIDSHCHLDFAAPAERAEIIARARAAGVGTMLTICTKLAEFGEVEAIAAGDPDIWCSAGIHPHEAAAEPEAGTPQLVALAAHPRVVGIGETGLDFHYDHSPRAAPGGIVPRPLRGGARDRIAAHRPYPRGRPRDDSHPA